LLKIYKIMAKDYYKILGVTKMATEDEIKKAYRKLAHQHHPDKSHGNEAKFKEVNEAYQILSNKEKRAQYDRFGQVFEGAPAGGAGNWGDFGFGGFGGEGFNWQGFGADNMDFGDIFETIFEQFGGRKRQTYTQGSDIEMTQELTLEEAFSGLKRHISYQTYDVCGHCEGLGYEKSHGLKTCMVCQGRGEVRIERKTFFGNISQVKACTVCNGRGQIPNKTCSVCAGKGRVLKEKIVNIEIAPGVEDGQIIKIRGAGEVGERGGGPGDLYVIIKVKPHGIFERRKTDLYTTKEVKLLDALLGKKINCEDVSGEKFQIVIPAGFNFQEKMKVAGRGMPRFGSFSSALGRGDLYVTFNVKLPKHLSVKAKKLLEDLDREL